MTGARSLDRNHALTLLAEHPNGCSSAIMVARGCSPALLNRLVRTGLATSQIERKRRGDKAIEIVCVKITEAGRKAIAHPSLEVRCYH
jgi:hypothetical protein